MNLGTGEIESRGQFVPSTLSRYSRTRQSPKISNYKSSGFTGALPYYIYVSAAPFARSLLIVNAQLAVWARRLS
jgi:hypothetical protein